MSPQDAPLRCLSLGRSAPAELREALTFVSSDIRPELARARKNAGPGGAGGEQGTTTIRRLVILSTCHRVELYAEVGGTADEARDVLIDWLASARTVARERIAVASIYMEGSEALRHLHRVTAGLDSAMLGEGEIIAQVRAALQHSVAVHAASPALKSSFRSALTSAENVRKSVWQRFPRADIGSVAVDAIAAQLGDLDGRQTLVIGAGHAGTLAARALYHAGARLTIVNRTGERAASLAARFKARCAPFSHLAHEVARADAIIVATSAPQIVLDAEMLAGAAGREHPIVVVDTSMPRNADPAIRSMPGADLVDLDELHARTAAAHVERAVAVPEVEAMTDSAVAELVARSRAPSATRSMTIGTRGSALARRQAEQVVAMLGAAHPDIEFRWRVYASSGDDQPGVPFADLSDDAFTDRIERALLEGAIDVAIHSFKDLPRQPVAGLVIAAVPVRADPREALVARDGATLATLPPGAVIGTSSPRRATALSALRPDCTLRPIRGPVDVRLGKVLAGEYDAAIFALAGLQRLGLEAHVSEIFSANVIAPAAGQGALAVQCRERDQPTRFALASIDNAQLHEEVEAERAREAALRSTITRRTNGSARAHAPLQGQRILVTRPEAQAQSLCSALEAAGAVPVRLPLLRIEPVDPGAAAWRGIASSRWVIFTSSNGVEQAWNVAPPEARAALRGHARIAAIGPATAHAATQRGMIVQLIATTHVAESLAAELGDASGHRVLWLRGERARDALATRLSARGAYVDQIVVYRAIAAPLADDARAVIRSVDLVTLASPSAVERFVEVAGADYGGPVACIGPVTAASARTHGLRVEVVAATYTAEGLVAALQRAAPFKVAANA
ncbi:MAG TPA: hydroxymethylbilane synthase [Gemmatimonadaceae bacterium]|nr:hydroxymethylbilane synthase [Gemmatimonadaceae bacterium]